MKNQIIKKYTWAGWLIFYSYIILLSYFLFFSERYGRAYETEEFRYNLIFLKEISRFIKHREILGFESFVVNILGNIVAFAPFGFMLPLLSKGFRKFFYVSFLSLLFSLSVELIQLFFKVGIFDVDDIFLNTVGGILGYVFFTICHFIIRKVQGNKDKKSRG